MLIKIIISIISLSYVNADIGTILHLTDVHYDDRYSVGSPTQCVLGEPGSILNGIGCCHYYDIPKENSQPASKYGDYNCDTPLLLLTTILKHIKNITYPDFIIYTGDSASHHDITQSIGENLDAIKTVTDEIRNIFPNTKLYPVLGNHDTYPVDQTLPYVNQYILNHVSTYWNFLSTESQESIKNGGYYSELIYGTLRIIGLNTNYYGDQNINKHNSYAAQQWEWLENILKRSKELNEKVIIIAHFFPGSSITTDFNKKFIELTTTYKDIIVTNIMGHSHADQFVLYKNNNTFVGNAMVSPSLKPERPSQYPGFRLYHYERDTYKFLNYEQYNCNLKKIIDENRFASDSCSLSYSFRDSYNVEDLTLESWINFYKKMEYDDSLFHQYYGRIRPGNTRTCDGCKKSVLDKIIISI